MRQRGGRPLLGALGTSEHTEDVPGACVMLLFDLAAVKEFILSYHNADMHQSIAPLEFCFLIFINKHPVPGSQRYTISEPVLLFLDVSGMFLRTKLWLPTRSSLEVLFLSA